MSITVIPNSIEVVLRTVPDYANHCKRADPDNMDGTATGSVTMSSGDPNEPRFWRDPALPFVEARSIRDGRHVCYGKHAHETFSIGFVTHGRCTYLNGRTRQPIRAGTVVLMNPGDVHACNPSHDEPW